MRKLLNLTCSRLVLDNSKLGYLISVHRLNSDGWNLAFVLIDDGKTIFRKVSGRKKIKKNFRIN
jgi:hypothetical protein